MMETVNTDGRGAVPVKTPGPGSVPRTLGRVTGPETLARWVPRLVTLVAVVALVSAFYRPQRGRLEVLRDLFPQGTAAVATAATLATGFVLLALVGGLRRRTVAAWWAATLVVAALEVLHLLKGLDVEEAVIGLPVLVLLLRARPAFTARRGARSWARTGLVAVVALLGAWASAVAVVRLSDDLVAGAEPGWGAVVEQATLGLVGVPGPLAWARFPIEVRVQSSLLALGVAVVIVVLISALRPRTAPPAMSPAEFDKAVELLARPDADSLGWFALRDDRSLVVEPSGRAAISYRVVSSVALAAGDPLGDPKAWPAAIAVYLERCRAAGWVPAVLGASETGAQAWHSAGLDAWELGDEAILDTATFSLEGRAVRGVRQAVARVGRAGVSTAVRRVGDVADEEVRAIGEAATRWREGEEHGFSMALSRFGDPRDADAVLVTARDADAALVGVLQLVPWGTRGLSLDLMRRDPGGANGIVEAMVVALVAAAPALSVERVSLNFAVFRSVFARAGKVGAGPVLRVWHRTLVLASRWWQIESLYRANAKYQPAWSPRFLCFARLSDVPRVSVAAMEAEAFLHRPRWLGGASL